MLSNKDKKKVSRIRKSVAAGYPHQISDYAFRCAMKDIKDLLFIIDFSDEKYCILEKAYNALKERGTDD